MSSEAGVTRCGVRLEPVCQRRGLGAGIVARPSARGALRFTDGVMFILRTGKAVCSTDKIRYKMHEVSHGYAPHTRYAVH